MVLFYVGCRGGASSHSQRSGADEPGSLKFGFPQMFTLPDGTVFAVFWCCEQGVHNIRWFRIRV